jgi:two-component system, OmpR family, alkaline phosphatase synthesis response regulator PhoP
VSSTRIVVADDSDMILSLVVLALQREGYEPATATNGADALARIREVRPQLVILDALMPNLDGYDVCRAVRDDPELERPYVIMLTAGARESDRERAEVAGVDEFITKPFSPAELRARVREILGS